MKTFIVTLSLVVSFSSLAQIMPSKSLMPAEPIISCKPLQEGDIAGIKITLDEVRKKADVFINLGDKKNPITVRYADLEGSISGREISVAGELRTAEGTTRIDWLMKKGKRNEAEFAGLLFKCK